MLAPYARAEEALIIALGAVATAATVWLAGAWALAPALLALALLSFYRDPPRRIPGGDNLILAPADGRITEVGNATSPDGAPQLRIVIFLSVANVHVNRAPCAGVVRSVDYRPGLFLNALRPDSTERNESNTLTLDPAPPLRGPIVVRQIAGVLARRIVCAARPGHSLVAGQRFGMIKLGSRTEIRLPADPRWNVRVRVGDTVHGGTTILAALAPHPG